MGNRLANFQRTGRIAQVLVRHGVLALLGQVGSGGDGARLGRRLARALDDLGPTFVKLGQILATREDMLPAAVARELSQLQDNAGPISARAARMQIERSLHAPVEQLFARFDDEPLAAGSIAQVHRARTFRGDDVVVKIRRPGIERVIAADLELLEGAAEWLSQRFPELRRHDAVGFAREFGRGLRAELDLACEAESIEHMRKVLRGTARIPKVFPSLSSHAVLTLEFVEGCKVSDVADPAARQQTAKQIVASFATQYLRGTMFHADPHAGNLVRCPDGNLSMFDLGAVGEIDGPTRRALMRLSLAAARRNGNAMAKAVLAMVHAPDDLDRAAYRADMAGLLGELVSRPLGEIRISVAMNDMFSVARKHGLRFRAEYFLLFRSSMLVDGVLRTLDPAIDPVAATRAHIVRSWYQPAWFGPAIALATLAAFNRTARLAGRARVALARQSRRLLPPKKT